MQRSCGIRRGYLKNVERFDRCRLSIRRRGLVEAFRDTSSLATLIAATLVFAGCAGAPRGGERLEAGHVLNLREVKLSEPVELNLKAELNSVEKVDYLHRSASRSFENQELRHERDETIEFTAEAFTARVEPEHFTQVVTVPRKEGSVDLHDFAMPEPGESLEITLTPKAQILKASDWPRNSIFYVPPVSLPAGPVNVGDTWAMRAQWAALADQVPYELDMVSILKRFVACGEDTCAEIEVSGEVAMSRELQMSMQQTILFKSEWRGTLLFAIKAGTVLWSRVDSEELFAFERVRRDVRSCLEARLAEPLRLIPGGKFTGPACENFRTGFSKGATADTGDGADGGSPRP